MTTTGIATEQHEDAVVARQGNLTHGLRKEEIWSCRFLLVMCFAVLLPVAIMARLSGWRWRPWPSGAEGYRSPFEEARHMAATITGTVFST